MRAMDVGEAGFSMHQLVCMNPEDPDAYYKRGVALQESGRRAEAVEAYRTALALYLSGGEAIDDPRATLFGRSNLRDAAQKSHAIASSSSAACKSAAAHLANLLIESKHVEEGRAWLEQVLAVAPDHPHALLGMARLLSQCQPSEAEAWLERALKAKAAFPEALTELALLKSNQNDMELAESLLRRALGIAPGYVPAAINLGIVLHRLGQLEEACAALHQASYLDSANAKVYGNLSHSLYSLGNYADAEESARRAIELDPTSLGVLNNLGVVRLTMADYPGAEDSFRRALALDPFHALARFNLATLLLLTGRFTEGWQLLESRPHSILRPDYREFDGAPWDGTPLQGRTLMLHHEGGFGDTLQFIRYATQIASGDGRVVLVVPRPLARLLEGLPGPRIETEIPASYDCQAYLGSLPRLLDTQPETIPADVPYIRVPDETLQRWVAWFAERCPDHGKPLVGLVWAGDISHGNDERRSIPFDVVKPLLTISGIRWVILQMGRRPDELQEVMEAQGCLDPMPEVRDYADTAGIIEQLDLVICADTSVAHLCGALGKPVWTLLPSNPDWRWLLSRPESSPWYPSMRLFRQAAMYDWRPVIANVAQALAERYNTSIDIVDDDPPPSPTQPWFPRFSLSGNMDPDQAALRERIGAIPFWHHRIDLPGGLTTPGWMPINPEAYALPERLDGLRILDVGAWDGYWTFEALRRGAREVVAIDDFSDILGVQTDPPWRNWDSFDLCRKVLGYDEDRCQRQQLSVYEVSEKLLGRFDIILFFGIFHQLRHPLLALDRMAAVCEQTIYVEGPILDDYSAYRGLRHGHADGQMVMECYPGNEDASKPMIRQLPTLQCLGLMVNSAGFSEVECWKLEEEPRRMSRCRGFVKGARQ